MTASARRECQTAGESSKNGLRTLVTGGAGFIGSHIVRHLLARGDEVIVLDNFSTGKRENIEDLDITLIEADIRDINAVKESVREVDTVFHQAALCSVARSVKDPISTHSVNASGTLNVFEASRLAGVRRVVYASSSSVYGESQTLPKRESMPTSPLSPYAVSKLSTEYYGELYGRMYGLETVGLRYFNVFGPRQDPNSDYAAVIPKFVKALLEKKTIQMYGDGTQTRDFTYIDNVVQANLLAAISPTAPGQAINVACGNAWSLLELVATLESITHEKTDIMFCESRPGDIKHSLAAIEKAEEILGYKPIVQFAQGIRETLDWFIQTGLPTLQTKPPVMGEHAGSVFR
ncbi:UDP-glucose 4-epimerase [Litorivivens lipolytica]|uniref:UDP-glucose 4-epimerase n=1 Tax=Litorivivens lipolytica TaxID=1524264 RepID=A0A7W4Z5T4_9GAMM|nr:SDR family oxidoreductase [Litorivivens lipolytica]MBB3047839.1 UDP-glucose 4-epimerase [Litorivivens lipolytica]